MGCLRTDEGQIEQATQKCIPLTEGIDVESWGLKRKYKAAEPTSSDSGKATTEARVLCWEKLTLIQIENSPTA